MVKQNQSELKTIISKLKMSMEETEGRLDTEELVHLKTGQ